MLDALTFGLFNKPFRKINKPQLANTINEKDCLVEVEFSVNGKEYLVRRGIKPNVFDIEVNGNLLHKEADDRANQRILEENVLKLNYKSFTQIVILGSSTFVPFMQLTTANRREVIEDLLDISIFSAMSNLLKENMKEKKDQIKSLELKKSNLKEKIEMQQQFINELEQRGNSNIAEKNNKIDKFQKEINIYIEDNILNQKEIDLCTTEQEKVSGSKNTLVKLNNLKGKLSQKVSMITKEHKFFTENTVCPTCTQDIEEEFRVNRISDAQNQAKKLKEGYEELEKTIKLEQEREHYFTKLSREITTLTHDISQNNTRINYKQKQIRELEHEIQTITSNLQNRNTENEKLEEFRESLQKAFENLSSKREELVHYDFAYSLLKDDGVKTKIIKKYLPFINQQINRYLQMMDFYINFKLDEEFNETVESLSLIHI